MEKSAIAEMMSEFNRLTHREQEKIQYLIHEFAKLHNGNAKVIPFTPRGKDQCQSA